MVYPTVIYVAATWGISVLERNKLHIKVINYLRSMLRGARSVIMRNKKMNGQSWLTEKLSDRVDRTILEWLADAEHMGEERLNGQVPEWYVRGRKKKDI